MANLFDTFKRLSAGLAGPDEVKARKSRCSMDWDSLTQLLLQR